MPSKTKHFLGMPFPGIGHILPMIELLKHATSRGHKVTLAISAAKYNIVQKRKMIPPVFDCICLEDGLTEDYDKDLQPSTFRASLDKTFIAQKRLQNSADYAFDAIVLDVEYFTVLQLCIDKKLPVYLFASSPAWTVTGGLKVEEDTPTVPDDYFFKLDPTASQENMAVPLYEYAKEYHLTLNKFFPHVECLIVNSVEFLEEQHKRDFEESPKAGGTPIKFVGPLYGEQSVDIDQSKLKLENELKRWLDECEPEDVVYVSFGTMAIPKPQQVVEIAQALLELGRPFVWSLPTEEQSFVSETDLMGKLLEKGKVFTWMPQRMILEHPLVGVFVSHCGWNSVLEGLLNGKPFVCWPMFVDQPNNAELLVKLGVGHKIPGTSAISTELVLSEALVSAVNEVISESIDGNKTSYQLKALELATKIKAAMADGGSSKAALTWLFN